VLIPKLMTDLFQATTCPKTSSRKASSVRSGQRRPRPPKPRTAPRSETPAKRTWTYVYNHDVDKRTRWSGYHEQFLRIFPSSIPLFLCLATNSDFTDRKTVVHKTHLSADLPTARTLTTVASLDHSRRYSIILIRIAISNVKASSPAPDCCSNLVSSLTASLYKTPIEVSRLACGLRCKQTKKNEKHKKRALQAKVCVAICCLCSSLTTSTAMLSTETITCKAACIARTAST
jgi:hypothetical protein